MNRSGLIFLRNEFFKYTCKSGHGIDDGFIVHAKGDPEMAGLLAAPETGQVLAAMEAALADHDPSDVEGWKAYKKAVQQTAGVKGRPLFHAIRVALTGAASGPELDRLVPLIGSGSALFPRHVPSIRDRVQATARLAGG